MAYAMIAMPPLRHMPLRFRHFLTPLHLLTPRFYADATPLTRFSCRRAMMPPCRAEMFSSRFSLLARRAILLPYALLPHFDVQHAAKARHNTAQHNRFFISPPQLIGFGRPLLP